MATGELGIRKTESRNLCKDLRLLPGCSMPRRWPRTCGSGARTARATSSSWSKEGAALRPWSTWNETEGVKLMLSNYVRVKGRENETIGEVERAKGAMPIPTQ